MSNTRSPYDFMGYLLQEFPEWVGLDYDSAIEAMPRLYGVSFGNGNDGVSHTYPNFYVRTCEPYTLAAAAMLAEFTPGEGHEWVSEHMEVDGEADYSISATLYDPPDDRKDYESELKAAQEAIDAAETDDEREEAGSELERLESEDPGYWSEFNGAWMICEIFPVSENDVNGRKPVYTSLADCFSAEIIEMARAI